MKSTVLGILFVFVSFAVFIGASLEEDVDLYEEMIDLRRDGHISYDMPANQYTRNRYNQLGHSTGSNEDKSQNRRFNEAASEEDVDLYEELRNSKGKIYGNVTISNTDNRNKAAKHSNGSTEDGSKNPGTKHYRYIPEPIRESTGDRQRARHYIARGSEDVPSPKAYGAFAKILMKKLIDERLPYKLLDCGCTVRRMNV